MWDWRIWVYDISNDRGEDPLILFIFNLCIYNKKL